jgi:hypothetical protein
VREHRVGAERFAIDETAATRIEAARAQDRPILEVGTTVTRTLEMSTVSTHSSTPLTCSPMPRNLFGRDAGMAVRARHQPDARAHAGQAKAALAAKQPSERLF